MGMIENDWQPAVQEEFGKPYYKELYQFVKEEYSTHVSIRHRRIFLMHCI